MPVIFFELFYLYAGPCDYYLTFKPVHDEKQNCGQLVYIINWMLFNM